MATKTTRWDPAEHLTDKKDRGLHFRTRSRTAILLIIADDDVARAQGMTKIVDTGLDTCEPTRRLTAMQSRNSARSFACLRRWA